MIITPQETIIIPQEVYIGEDFFLPILYEFELWGQEYPQDISGYVVEMQIGTGIFIAGNTPIVDVSTLNGDISIDGPNGKINIWIPDDITATCPVGCFNYGVKVTTNMGLIERLIGGPFKFKGW